MTTTTQLAGEPTELPFEDGYDRLQAIANRLNDDDVPVSEMCDLFAEGRGLELALTEFLDTQRQRVEAIERGEGIRRFRISRVAAPGPDPSHPDNAPPAKDTWGDDEFIPDPPRTQQPTRPAAPPSHGSTGDSIPF